MTATYVRFAAFVVVCVVAAAVIIVLLGNLRPFESRHTYEAVLPHSGGLLVGDAVKIAGVEVGRVDRLRIEEGRTLAIFSVREDRRLGEETELGVRWRNVLGLRYLYLYPAGDGALPPGHRFPTEAVRPHTDLTTFLARVTPVMQALDPDVTNVVVAALAEALAGREAEVRGLVEDAGSFLLEVGEHNQEAARALEHGATLIAAYADREAELRLLLERFSEVTQTVAERNDALVAAITSIADVEAEIYRLLETNDGDIRAILAELDAIGAVLAAHHDEVEDILAYTSRGIVTYHRISRWGQWFNIRVPGISVGEVTLLTERDAALPTRVGSGGSAASDGAGGLARLLGHGLVGPGGH